MAIIINARPKKIGVGKNAGKKVYKLTPQHVNKLSTEAVCRRASKATGISHLTMQICFRAIAEELKNYLPIGHSVELEGLGTFRLSMRATTVERLEDVSVDNIYRMGIVFTPSKDIIDFLNDEPLRIHCFDNKGKLVRRLGVGEEQDDDVLISHPANSEE